MHEQIIKVPEHFTKFFIDHEMYMDEFGKYCAENRGKKKPRDIFKDFWAEKGFGDEMEMLLKSMGK